MKIDTGIPTDIALAGPAAAEKEAAGFDAAYTVEMSHDPFLPVAMATQSTSTIELGTSIAVAFARNPMNVANMAYDLQKASHGRFTLGLGSQIKPHITKRFSMEWSKPAARMRDFIQALNAIWDYWDSDATERMEHRGEFYQHTLMTPMFNPGPNPHGHAKVLLAGVGPLMTEVAGEVADGFIAHAFTTAEYFADVTMPALEAGMAKGGRDRADFEITMPLFNVIGDTDEELEASAKGARQQIAFYGSTPAYAKVLEHHGWGEVHTKLNAMSKQGQWVEMADLITDDILDAFAIVGTAEELPGKVGARWGGQLDRISFYADVNDTERWSPLFDQLREIS